MKRFAAMHDWPLLIVRALTAVVIASSRLAEGITMNGSLPPSSSTVFLICLPAMLATLAVSGNELNRRDRSEFCERGEGFDPRKSGGINQIGYCVVPKKIAAEDDWRFFLLHDDDGISASVAGEKLDVKNDGAQAKLGFGIVESSRRGEIFDHGFLFWSDGFAEEFKIFRVNPGRHVAMRDDDGALFGEDGVSGDMIKMVVGVDDELDWQFTQHANFAEQSFCGGLVLESVDDGDTVFADNEASVGARFAFGVIDGGINAVPERFESEGKGSIRFGRKRVSNRGGRSEEHT